MQKFIDYRPRDRKASHASPVIPTSVMVSAVTAFIALSFVTTDAACFLFATVISAVVSTTASAAIGAVIFELVL